MTQRTRNCKLHYSEVRGDVLRPSYCANTKSSEDQEIVKGMTLETNEHTYKA